MTDPTYDELALFHENAAEAGLAWTGPPAVERVWFDAPSGGRISALRWGHGPAEVVLLHGGAQNAHTWDTVALALDRPLVAIDLPGFGRSSWRDDHDYRPHVVAPDVAAAIEAFAPDADAVVGMSLGGLTAIAVSAVAPQTVRRLALVDVTPGVDRDKAAAVIAFVEGPESFESFAAILQRTIDFNPTRSRSSLRRGVLHNAEGRSDGTWRWRYDRLRADTAIDDGMLAGLWDSLGAYGGPLLLVRGARSPVVSDDDVAELLRRQPAASIVVAEGSGHSVQGDEPVLLAGVIADFIA
jgi:pimeloyl-ACP methyl ester carboxylesterase